MTIPINSLLIVPNLDASKYAAGAQQKVAADKAMSASSQAVGAAVQQTDTKISQAGDVLARLSRQYVDGYATAQRMQGAVNSLSRGIETGKITMMQAEPILEGIFRKYGQLGDGAQFAAKGQHEFANAITNTTARLTAQMAAANAAAASVTKVHAVANQNAGVRGGGNFNSSNAAFQVQDAVMMAMMGQAPMATAFQQGPQLAMAVQQGGGLKALGAGILSLVSPTMLFTVGATAAAAATIQWFMKGKDGAKTLEDALKSHSDTLRLLKGQYGDLGEAAKSVGNSGGMAFTGANARNAQRLIEAQLRARTEPLFNQLDDAGWMKTTFGSSVSMDGLRNLGGDQKNFAAPLSALIESAKSGKTDLAGFNDEVERLFEQLVGSSQNPAALRDAADAVLLLGTNAFDVTGKFAPFEDAINRLKIEGAQGIATFNAEVEKIGRANGLQKLADEAIIAGKEIVDLADKAAELEKILQRIDREDTRPGLSDRRDLSRYVGRRGIELQSENDQFAAEQQMARARTNAERLAAVEAQVRARAREDGDSGGGMQARVDRALAAERNRQAIEERDASSERERAQSRSIESAREELSLIGATAGEVARLGYEYSEIARLREEAARRGEKASESDIARIKETAAELGKLADAAARLSLSQDLGFERDQMFRSPTEQGIAGRLRGTGIGMNSAEAQMMRDMQEFADAKGLALGFLNTFKSALIENGGDVGDALGKAVLSALSNSMDKQLSNIFDKLATAFASALTGMKPGAGFAANMTAGQFFGAASPIAANSNSPLSGGMSAYREAIAAIESQGSGGYSALGPWTKGDRAYGRYQVMGNNIPSWTKDALGRSLTPEQFLADSGAQDSVFDKQFGSSIAKYGNPQDAASVWFTGRPMSQGAGARDVLGTSGSVYVDKFNAQLAKLGNTADGAVKGLDGFASNLTQVGSSLTSPNGPLGGLFGTGLDNFANFKDGAGGGLGGLLGYSGGQQSGGGGGGGGLLGMILGFLPKLFGFADGTDNAPPGMAWVGERGPEIVRFRGGEQVVPNHKLGAGNQNAAPPRAQIHVNVQGANGDAHVRMLVNQGIQQGMSNFYQEMARGGFGAMQNTYNNQKAG